ncbi:MAG: tRNA (adenosine(37)-N6)-dimethylallyltransferase MiaA [Pseudomonadota bacterium]
MAEAAAPPRPILLAGPTASGKSALALAMAERLGGEIVNADSQQVWADWRVVSARPSRADEARVPHHLYGHRDGAQRYSAGDWLREAEGVLGDIAARGRRAIICGGTGLYFTALTEGLSTIPPIPDSIRAEVDRARQSHDAPAFAALLAAEDPETAERIDRANPARVARALEVIRATGRSLTSWQAETGAPRVTHAVTIALMPDPKGLDARIADRFRAMVAGGALEEAAVVARRALPHGAGALKPLGASELIAHVEGRLSLDEAIARATLATRRYAKRQRTWIRGRMKGWTHLPTPAPLGALAVIRATEGT